jgi:hypothetical protein
MVSTLQPMSSPDPQVGTHRSMTPVLGKLPHQIVKLTCTKCLNEPARPLFGPEPEGRSSLSRC